MRISEAIQFATELLASSGVENARWEARLLLSTSINRDMAFLIAHPDYELSEPELDLFKQYSLRRAKREPFQYICGYQEFYGLKFSVSRDVLIPRPETELVVEQAINFLQIRETRQFCDIGIGSGCISIAILKQVSNSFAVGCDVSERALELARNNAQMHGVADRLRLIVSDILLNVDISNGFDLIVSNPPYISKSEFPNLQPEVRDYEPRLALLGGEDGLEIIQKLILQARGALKPGGKLIMEIGHDQADAVSDILQKSGWNDVDFIADLRGFLRVVVATKRSP